MRKLLFVSFFIFLTFSFAEEKSYVFEAKGKFAEELKALVEKYSKDGKVDVTVYESKDAIQSESKTMTQSILSAFTNDDAEELKYADVQKGEALYQKTCAQCHGEKAETKKYAYARILTSLQPLEIIGQLKGYKQNYDGQFGGSTRMIMKPQADALTATEMQSIAVYIYSLKHGTDISKLQNTTEAVPTTTSQGSYLK